METEALIRTLAADGRHSPWPLSFAWRAALGLGVIVTATLFFVLLGPRPDFAAAMATLRFPFKFAVTIALALGAFGLLKALSRPGAKPRWSWLLGAPALLLAAVALELWAVPESLWPVRLVGTNSMNCLFFIPLLGIGPLALFLLALRHGAPTRPVLAGAVAGLLAGGVAATFYAAQCFDDSPLFVATWYTMAIAGLAGLGALLGTSVARW